jgi:NTP hydrolase family protein
VDVYLIDEVGKMELFCPAFVEAVPRLLDDAVPLVLTVAQKGPGLIASLCFVFCVLCLVFCTKHQTPNTKHQTPTSQVKARADVRLVTVTGDNPAAP